MYPSRKDDWKRSVRFTALAMMLGLLLLAPAARADARDAWDLVVDGVQQYRAGKLDGCILTLKRARKKTDDPQLVARIRLYIGASHAGSARIAPAKKWFSAALDIDPEISLDPQYSTKTVLALLEEVRWDKQVKPELTASQKSKPPETEPGEMGGRLSYKRALDASAGLMLLHRNFDFSDPISPRQLEDHSEYRSKTMYSICLESSFFPLYFLSRSRLSNVGLKLRYYQALGHQALSPQSPDPIDTEVNAFETGLFYRWNVYARQDSPTLDTGLEFGRLEFSIKDEPTAPVAMPDIEYTFMKLALVDLDVPVYRLAWVQLGLTVAFDYLIVLSTGEMANTDASGYGRSSTAGIDVQAGLFANGPHLYANMGWYYRRFSFDFDNVCYQNNLGCRAARGAVDVYNGFSIMLGYAL